MTPETLHVEVTGQPIVDIQSAPAIVTLLATLDPFQQLSRPCWKYRMGLIPCGVNHRSGGLRMDENFNAYGCSL